MNARAARIAAGLSITDAARRARVSPAYLRQLERSGSFPYNTARRLARLYGCDGSVFLYHRAEGPPQSTRPARPQTRAGRR